MAESYEYKNEWVFLGGGRTDSMRPLGDGGWEAVRVVDTEAFVGSPIQIVFRRPAAGADSWEYHLFGTAHDSDAWRAHLASCGWEIVARISFRYYGAPWTYDLAKRPGRWRGSDDGDVDGRLKDLAGFEPDLLRDAVPQILRVKWEESARRGHNVGTYAAARHWLAHTILPRLFERRGRALPDRDPEALLDELQNIRQGIAPYAPLGQAVEEWVKLNP